MMKQTNRSASLNVRVPQEYKDFIEDKANKDMRSISDIVNMMIEKEMKKDESSRT